MDEEADALFARITGTSAATSAPIARTSAASATPIAPGVGVELPRPDQGRYLPINDNGIQFPELPPLIAFSPAGWERTPESPITAVLGVPVLDSEFAEAVGNLARLEGKSDGLLAMAAQMRQRVTPTARCSRCVNTCRRCMGTVRRTFAAWPSPIASRASSACRPAPRSPQSPRWDSATPGAASRSSPIPRSSSRSIPAVLA